MRPTASPERHLERAWPSSRSSSAPQRQPIEIDGHHLVEALLCHLFDEQELAVICVYADAVQVPELPLDRGEHRVQVGELADVRADGETSGSKRLLSRLQPPLVQAADGDARAPSRSTSCAAARPIPLLPPVIRIFLFASLPIVVTPLALNIPVSVTVSVTI